MYMEYEPNYNSETTDLHEYNSRDTSNLQKMQKISKTIYDLVIIGGGPAGLTLAQCCSSIGKRVLIIERENDVGGCHRVRRRNTLFTEHGPRIYSSTYKVFISLLKQMNLNFYDLFTPYNFTISNIGNQTIWKTLSFRELFLLATQFIMVLFNDNYGLNITVQEYMNSNYFKKESIDLIDRICRLTDGASADKYTLNEFLQLLNQQFFHGIYQPNTPNDIGLFKHWKSHLYKKDVDILLNYDIKSFVYDKKSKQISQVVVNKNNVDINRISYDTVLHITGKKFIIATPPLHLVDLLENSNNIIKNTFGDFNILRKWAFDTAYIEYISLTFHWDKVIDLPKIYGFPKTEWGVAYIVLTDYMKFEEPQSKTVISVAVTITDRPDSNTNKTADSCTYNELIDTVFSQLQQSFPDLPKPTKSILSPGVYHNGTRWISKDTAFITSSNRGFLPFSGEIKNLYNVGTHNGYHLYKFTSLESAVTNAVKLSHLLYPELIHTFPITSATTVRKIIVLFFLFLLIIGIIIWNL